ncbi:MAG TPA: chorismate-binding protein, partial [Agromyces sp.]
MSQTHASARLVVRTVAVDETEPLIPRTDPRHPLVWLRRGEGIVGLGEVLRIESSGATRIDDAASAWTSLAAAADIDDRVGLPGTGLVAFGAFAFADESAVAEAVRRIDAGEFEKAVLARQLVGTLSDDAGLRATINRLAEDYPDTWVFAVDGLIGASPETLVRVDHGTVSARVLAGTAPRGAGEASDRDHAATLAASEKNLAEHALAVASAV